MRRQIRSEIRKITTTRTVWGLLAGLVALIGLGTIGALANAPTVELSRPLTSQDLLHIPLVALTIFSLVLGIRSFTDEFRHGSIVPTLLADPVRRRVLGAKLIVMAAMGLLFAVVAGGVSLAIVVIGLSIKQIAISTSAGAMASWVASVGVTGVLWAMLGVGLGLAIKHQVASIVGALVWITIGEGLLSALVPKLAKYLPASAGRAIHASDPALLGHIAGGFVLAAWMLVAIVSGAVLMQRRDVT